MTHQVALRAPLLTIICLGPRKSGRIFVIMNILYLILIAFVVLNIVTFFVYGVDKLKAKKGWWRISERTLLLLAFLGGSIGARLAMQIFRHKTQHAKFRYGVPFALLLHIALAGWLVYRFQTQLLAL